mgnify:CR=1 FL=1
MTKEELLTKLLALKEINWRDRDPEREHVEADTLLLAYIGDVKVTAAYHSIEKWYA